MIEHYGRRRQGLLGADAEDEAAEHDQRPEQCTYRFRFKECPHCGGENDIAARNCQQCKKAIIDPDDQLRDALKLKDAMVIRCAGITVSNSQGKLKIIYHGEDGEELSETFALSKPAQRHVFNRLFGRRLANAQTPQTFSTHEVLPSSFLPTPDFVSALEQKSRSGKCRNVVRLSNLLSQSL